jgi:NADH-quinone oxidoreductase subunit E
MLTEEEREEIEAEFPLYPTRRAVLPEALKVVQRHRGWVSDDSLKDVAEYFQMTPDEVDGLATFYNMILRRPAGRHVILLCDSVSCYLTGFETLRAHLFGKLGIGFGRTTPDGRFTLLPTACLGLCETAPAMVIDQDIHGQLTPEKIDGILEKYV